LAVQVAALQFVNWCASKRRGLDRATPPRTAAARREGSSEQECRGGSASEAGKRSDGV